MRLQDAVRDAVASLKEKEIDEADFQALCLCCHIAGIKNSQFALHKDDEISKECLNALLQRVIDGEPLQYVLGKWDFYESEFEVGPGVLIPRPETEELVEHSLTFASSIPQPVIIDLCAGSGCIGISLAKKLPNATVYCVEKSPQAYQYLVRNAEGIGNVKTVLGDVCLSLSLPLADLIVSNPPYIRSKELSSLQSQVQKEPRMALDGGEDGLEFYRAINDIWVKRLRESGALFLEIGNDQGSSIRKVLTRCKDIKVLKDLYGNDRVVVAYRR